MIFWLIVEGSLTILVAPYFGYTIMWGFLEIVFLGGSEGTSRRLRIVAVLLLALSRDYFDELPSPP